jgi:hypothetical protein
MNAENERHLILDMIKNGKITAEEGLGLLNALSESESHPPDDASDLLASGADEILTSEQASHNLAQAGGMPESAADQASGPPPVAARWRSWWQYPLWAGVIITVIGALLMYWALQAYGTGFLFFCAWVPLMAGVFLTALAWQSRSERWLHLRVEQPPGEWPRHFAISFPVAPVGWFVRTFKGKISGLQDASVDKLLHALDENTSPDNPLFIDVTEGEHGERVQIFIG